MMVARDNAKRRTQRGIVKLVADTMRPHGGNVRGFEIFPNGSVGVLTDEPDQPPTTEPKVSTATRE
jgi:hypothetical protein